MKRKGFTLIELLAVITILAVILLITVPIVLNIINDSKNTAAKDSLELYGRAIENAVASYYTKYPQKNEVTLQELKQEKLLDYKGKEVICEQVEIYERDVYLAKCKVDDELVNTTYGKPIYALTTENYIGYYADVDGDGTVDGVIYADLAHSKEETTWGTSNLTSAKYSYEAKTNLNEYRLSKNNAEETTFGTNKIVKLKKDNDNPRFYVMALEDFTTGSYEAGNGACAGNGCVPGTYKWYYNAHEKMPYPVKDTSIDFGTGHDNTGTMIRIWNNNGAETGWTAGATQDIHDIWGNIQSEYAKGWYIPSLGEWVAFADYLAHMKENPLTSNYVTGSYVKGSGNYNNIYGLSDWYCSSSQNGARTEWSANFVSGNMSYGNVSDSCSVRLGVTF